MRAHDQSLSLSGLTVWRWCVVAVSTAVLIGACAQGEVISEDDGGQGGQTSSSTGAAGEGGMGGQGGEPVVFPCGIDCSTIDTPQCKQAVCDEATEQCIVIDEAEGTVCDDELFCTVNDACVAGSCEGGPPNDCGIAPQECHEVICDEASKSCSESTQVDGTACTSSDLCQVNTTCSNGLCLGTPKDCFFAPVPGPCWEAVCDPTNGICTPQPGNFSMACQDPTMPCTVGMTCDMMGNCLGGGPMDCSALTQGCFNGVCDMGTGQCVQQPVPPGGSCAEAADDCNAGVCDMNGLCNPVPANENGICEDGNPCTSGEFCTQGSCGGGQTVQQVIYFSEDFSDNSAGWTLGQEWQIGPAVSSPSPGACGSGDPGMDNTATADNGIAGVVIGGTAATTMTHPYYYITSPPMDTSVAPGSLWLGYYRWLNSDYTRFMANSVEVYNGQQWITVWQSGPPPAVQDASWTQQTHDITQYKASNMQVRFGFEIGSTGVYTCSGWNLDDVVVANVVCP